jgi:flagellar motor switch protein FliG
MNNNEELEEEKCLACALVEEFKELVDDNVNWEEALRYVIHIAKDIKDDIVADLVDEQYTLGFEDGLTMGVEKAASLVNEMVEYTKEEIVAYRAEREAELNGEVEEESEEIEDISDEDFEEYAKIIREYQERNL